MPGKLRFVGIIALVCLGALAQQRDESQEVLKIDTAVGDVSRYCQRPQ